MDYKYVENGRLRRMLQKARYKRKVLNNPNRPEARNLLMIYSILSGQNIHDLQNDLSDTGWGTFKKLIADQLIESLKPIQKEYQILIDDPYELNKILLDGQEKAEIVANTTLNRVKKSIGFI